MARKPQVAVEPRPDGRWAVQTNGTQRADSLHDRKSDAVKRGANSPASSRRSWWSRTNVAVSSGKTATATIHVGSRGEGP